MGLGQLSADTIGGWQNQFDRLTRWRQRCIAEMRRPYGKEQAATVLDFALSYFLTCHSLREWLIKDKAINKDALANDLKQYSCWPICRDIANRSRHFRISQNPVDPFWTLHREFDPFASEKNKSPRENWYLVFVDKRVELQTVVGVTYDMWVNVLSAHELIAGNEHSEA